MKRGRIILKPKLALIMFDATRLEDANEPVAEFDIVEVWRQLSTSPIFPRSQHPAMSSLASKKGGEHT